MRGGDRVAVGAVGRVQGPDLDCLSLGQYLSAEPLGKPQIVLDQRVLGPVAAADHAAPAADAAGSRRALAPKIGIGHLLARLAEEDADSRVFEGVGDADLARGLP